jgi:hypothetical protein
MGIFDRRAVEDHGGVTHSPAWVTARSAEPLPGDYEDPSALTGVDLDLACTWSPEEEQMRKLNMGWTMALALGLAIPSFSNALAAPKAAKTAKPEEAAGSTQGMSKDEQQRLAEHNKLRMEIKKVKYPAEKAAIVSHLKGIKADDKKWFSDTLPEKTYNSADEVFSALGW